MNRWLTVAFLVASAGGAFSLYSAISVGSTGLANMATNLQSLSVVVNNYYNALNTDRTLVNASLNDLGYYVNVTVSALNKTYGATQPPLSMIMSMAPMFNSTLSMGELTVNSMISSDLSQVSSNVQQLIDSIFQSFSMSLYTMSSYDQSYTEDKCIAKNMTQMSQIPNSVGKLGPCLQQEVNTANAITPTIVATIKQVKNDLIAYFSLMKICQPTSKTCLDQFFTYLSMDWSTLQTALYTVQQYVMYIQMDAANRNRVCGDLVRADIQDQIMNLQSTVQRCSYPQI
ncbi:uncharacterized protein LOC119769808 [Culex quinquefasciatus]|uniref:uncharacterized protein LOC119769808 n=1 Tax=Culex quinquefasciatus TaxID=7176 RepID=UPI0018E3CD43|nr:uncharacterized protein LOC119769808 [Culex quinquefasciatus]